MGTEGSPVLHAVVDGPELDVDGLRLLLGVLAVSDDDLVVAEVSGCQFPGGLAVGHPLGLDALGKHQHPVAVLFQQQNPVCL